jgi:hypothetical protein
MRISVPSIASLSVSIGCLLFAGIATAEGGPIEVAREISFAETSGVRDAVRDECKLQTKVTRFLDEYSEQVELVEDPSGSQDRLELTITNVHATGGGAWGGAEIDDGARSAISERQAGSQVHCESLFGRRHVRRLQGHLLDRGALREDHRQGHREVAREPDGRRIAR